MTASVIGRHRACLLNATRLDFDGRLDFSPIKRVVDLVQLDEITPDQIVERADGCSILITKEIRVPGEVAQDLNGEVKMICEAGTGTDNLDAVLAEAPQITVCNVPEYSTESVAWLAMRFVVDLTAGEQYQVRKVDGFDLSGFYRRELRPVPGLRGKTLGVIGAGAIGTRVLEMGRNFGLNVVYCRSKDPQNGGRYHVTLSELLKRSDFVSIHVPLKKETRQLIGAPQLDRMKEGARLINTARGGLIDQDAVIDAIRAGHLAGVALDVQDPEPLPEDHVLWSMENVILTPHIGWKEVSSRRRLVTQIAQVIQAFIDGAPINVVSRRG